MTPSDLKTLETNECRPLDKDPYTSYSLNFEDVILHRLFPVAQNGFYVDVGAGHPRIENDTFAFYQRGWRGINVEPNHDFHSALMLQRPRDINLEVVLSDSSGGTLTYYELPGSGLSTCDVEQGTAYRAAGHDTVVREVAVTTLSKVLMEAGVEHINILKVDVEGFEEKVLNGNDWDKFRPDVVLVEATYPETPVRRPTNILTSMEERGYRHVYFDGLNDFYLEREFPAPEGLTLPPNVFDRFLPREIGDLRTWVKSLQTEFKKAKEYTHSLQIELKNAKENAHALMLDNRRLRRAGEQMRAELLAMNQLLESLHAMTEQLDQQKAQLDQQKAQLDQQKAQFQQQTESLVASGARLTSVYSSLSWRLTAPLRWCDGIRRRIMS